MAVNGTYNIIAESPIGKQKGLITYHTHGDVLMGTADVMGETFKITDGKVDGDRFYHTIIMKTPMGKLKGKVIGKVEGDTVSGTFTLPIGKINFSGNRV